MEIFQNVDIDIIRDRARTARCAYIEDMENKLVSFEKKMLSKGFKVFWVSKESDVVEAFLKLLPSGVHHHKVCFDLPIIPSEFANVKSIQKISTKEIETGTQSAHFLFTQADFAVVETGTLVLLEKKSRTCLNHVPQIVILLDISKLVNKSADLETILYLRSFSRKQEYLPQEVCFINKPFIQIEKNVTQHNGEYDTHEVDISIFLYDNGVSTILENKLLRNALYCIDCGLCKSVCPIYEYDKEFSPIGLVRANCFEKHRQSGALFQNTLLCGNCEQVCPVQIPFVDMIIKEMQLAGAPLSSTSKIAKIFERRKKLNKMSASFQRFFFLRKVFGKNKKLYTYFKKQTTPFFNISWQQSHLNGK